MVALLTAGRAARRSGVVLQSSVRGYRIAGFSNGPPKGCCFMGSTRNHLAALTASVVVMLGLVSTSAGATDDTEPVPDPDAHPAAAPS